MAIRDETLRFLLKVEGGKELLQLAKQIDDVGDSGKDAEGKLNGLLDDLRSAKDVQKAIDKYRELGKSFVDYTSKITQGKAEIAALAAQEKEAAKALELQRSALDAAKKSLASFKDGTVGYLGTQKQIAAAQREAKQKVTELSQALKAGEQAYKSTNTQLESARTSVERLAAAQNNLREPIKALKSTITEAGLSVTKLGEAEKSLGQRSQEAANGVRRLAQSVKEEAQAAQQAARAEKEAEEATLRSLKARLQGTLALEKYKQKVREAAEAEQKLAQQKALEQTQKNAEETAKSFNKLGSSILSFGKNLLSITGIAGAVSAALGALSGFKLFSGAANSARELEATLSEVRAVSGATAEQLERMKVAAEQAASTTKFSANDAAQALGELARATGDADKAIAALPATLNLAQAAGLGVSESAIILTTTISQFGLAAADATRIADLFTREANSTQDTVEKLGLAMSYVAPLARQLGMSIEDTTAILGALAEQGFRGERAGTSLRNVFSKLLDPTSEFRKELLGLNITTTDAAKVIEQLAQKGEKGKQALLSLDSEARPAIAALVNTGGAGIRRLTEDFKNNSGEAERTAKIIGDTFGGASSRLGSAFDKLRRGLLEPLLAPLATEIDAAAVKIQAFIKTADFTKIQIAIKEFVLSGVESFKQFIGSVDFTKVSANISEFITSAKGSLNSFKSTVSSISSGIKVSIDAISLAFNVLKAGVETSVAAIAKAVELTLASLKKLADVNPIVALGKKLGVIKEDFTGLGQAAELFGDIASKGIEKATVSATNAQGAFEGIKTELTDTGTAAETTAHQVANVGTATEKLGISAGTAGNALGLVPDYLNQAGNAAAVTAGQFSVLNPALAQVAQSAESSAEAFQNQQRALIDARANVVQARDALIRLAESGETNVNAFQQAQSAWQSAQARLDELTGKSKQAAGGVSGLETAFASLGIKSQAELQNLASSTKAAFEAVSVNAFKSSAGLADARAAFEAYANAALAAVAQLDEGSKANVAASLRSQAAALGLSDSLEELIQKFLKLGGTSGGSAKQVADNMQSAASATKAVADNSKQATDEFNKAAEAAKQTKQETDGIQGSLSALTQITVGWYESFKQVSQEAGDLFNNILQAGFSGGGVGGGFSQYIAALNEASKITTETIAKQRAELNQQVKDYENLGDAGVDAFSRIGGVSENALIKLENFSTQIKEGNYDAGLLGQQELQPLQAAIDSAANRMRSLIDTTKQANDELRSMGQSLQDELDRASGNDTAIENRRFEEQIKRIKEIAEKGDAAAKQQAAENIRLADLVHKNNLKKIEDEKNARLGADDEVDNRRKRKSGSQSSSSSGGSSSGGLDGAGRGGQTIINNVSVNYPNVFNDQGIEDFSRKVKKHLDAIAFRSR